MIHFDANPEVYNGAELALHKERFMKLLELMINAYQKRVNWKDKHYSS